MKGNVKIFFIKDKKQEFLGRYSLTNVAELLGMKKGNLSNILNSKQAVSRANAFYMVDTSNKFNKKENSVDYFFEKIVIEKNEGED